MYNSNLENVIFFHFTGNIKKEYFYLVTISFFSYAIETNMAVCKDGNFREI